MNENNVTQIPVTPGPTIYAKSSDGFVKSVFGKLLTYEFWWSIASLVFDYSLAAFGTALSEYARRRITAAPYANRGVLLDGSSPAAGPNAAFSSAVVPQPTYRPGGYPSAPTGGSPSYPGFSNS